MEHRLLRITAPHFVAGIVTNGAMGYYNGYPNQPVLVHKTAPILKYMKGWSLNRIVRYCHTKGWKCEIMP